MKYLGYMPNDFINGEGISVSVWTSGCPFHCKGCHNPESWDYNNGYKVPAALNLMIKRAILANGLHRNLSILGGEPLCEQNRDYILNLIRFIRKEIPSTKIFLWTGYTHQELCNIYIEDKKQLPLYNELAKLVDVLITGRFEIDKRTVNLPLRGSSNQKITYFKNAH